VPGSAEARVAVKAARFRTAFVQLRACGVLRTACDSPAFPPRQNRAHADANGFNLRIDYLPLNEAEIVVRVAGDKQAESGGDAE
jgi:hypothetical protein